MSGTIARIYSDTPVAHEAAVRILVVDDVPTNRAVIKSLLSRPTYQITEAGDGTEALRRVRQEAFDLVILDVLMPGLNGLDVLKSIRERYSESELPVLMLTVKDDIEDVVKALELGANDYVTRPIDYSVLVARINTLISYKHTQDSIRKSHAALESRIAERTKELLEANRALRGEVVERKHAEEKARVSEQRYRLLYDDTPSMFFTLDPSGEVLSANRFGAEQLGYHVDQLVGRNAAELHHPRERDAVTDRINYCLHNPDRVHRWETCMLRRDSSPVWVRVSARVMDGTPSPDAILLVCEDITEARTLSEQLSYQAKHDALTGLFNRREFELRLLHALERSREDYSEHALCYMDLDQFKIINDTCGHVAGDELLRQLSTQLQKTVRPNDTLARLGGDEFAVLITDCDLERAVQTANALRQTIVDYRFLWGDSSFSIAVSIGLVPISHTSQSIASVLSAADTACYAAKDEGRNRIHIYQEDDAEIVRRYGEMEWVAKINSALEEDRFQLLFQSIKPIGELKEDKGCHYELLVRMRDEKGALISPDSFFPTAERYKYSVRVDRWVITRAFDWLAQHPQHLTALCLCSINLSGHSLGDAEFRHFVLEEFQRTGVPPHKICFEITETAAIANLSAATRFMKEIRDLKCQFALDDFGSGLSSFAYLKNLPVDFIKIDGLFVKDIAVDPIDYAMVKSINEIAKVMGKQTIAEFVENQVTIDMLGEIGVDYAQGYAISEPRPIHDLSDIV